MLGEKREVLGNVRKRRFECVLEIETMTIKILTIKKKLLLFCLLLFLIHFAEFVNGQNEDIRFDHIDSLNSRLSQNSVFCTLKDSKGFMWFGTQHGLNRYDGRNFIVYDDSKIVFDKGVFGNTINAICEDNGGKIWVATDKGLLKFDPVTESFQNFFDCIGSKSIQAICKGSEGKLWVGSEKELILIETGCGKDKKSGIKKEEFKYEIQTICCGSGGTLWVGTESGLFRKYPGKKIGEEVYELDGSKNRSISDIYKDANNDIWVGTGDGILFKYDTSRFRRRYTNKHGIGLNAIGEDGSNRLWLGFNGDGIVIFPKNNGEPFQIVNNPYDRRGLNDNYVQSIFKDNTGTIWIGTFSGGVNKYNSKKEKFTTYFNEPGNKNSLSENSIFAIFEGSDGLVWIGTYSGEVDKFNPEDSTFKSVRSDAFGRNSILSIFEDSGGELWISTANGGFYRCTDRNRGEYEKITNDSLLGRKRVRVIKEDQDRIHLWIGTEEKGIVRFNPRTKEFDKDKSFSADKADDKKERLSDNNIYSILPDKEYPDIIWVGTAKGIDRVNKNSGVIISIRNQNNQDQKVFSICPDPHSKDFLWLGTDSGLCKLVKWENAIVENFKKDDGLPDNIVYGILDDGQGYIWFSTNNGISRFNPQTGRVEKNFDVSDGLQANEFNSGAYFKNDSGYMYFGGTHGLSVFHPNEIKIDKVTPPIYLTKLKTGGEVVKVGAKNSFGEPILIKSISDTRKVVLDYRKQPIVVEYSALDYNVPSRVKYKCRLYELNKGSEIFMDMKKTRKENVYTLPNLREGSYKIRIWGSNSDGHFNMKRQKPVELEIIIRRDWAETIKPFVLPIVLAIIVSLFVIIAFYKIFKNRAKKRIEKLEMIETAIDKVSRQENLEDVIKQMLDKIVYDFGFDYAAISKVDFLSLTISTVLGKSRITKDVEPNDWKHLSTYSLNDNDILTEVVKKKKTIEIIGPKIDIAKNQILNEEIFTKYNHKDLIRVFVPIEYLEQNEDDSKLDEQLVLGVIEAGFHKTSTSRISRELKIILEIFSRYCAVQFYRAMKIKERQTVDELLRESSEIDDHEKYLYTILKESVELVRGEKGDISFFSFNDNKININDSPIFYNIDSEEDRELIKRRSRISKRKGIVRHAADTNHYYFSGNVKKDDYYIEEFENVNSELAVPIRYSERVIGVLNIYSDELNSFDDRKANIIQQITDEAGKIYQKKKINQTIKNLVMPFHLFTGIDKIYELIINKLRDYFITEFVSVWERTEEKEIKYRLENACNKLKREYNKFGLKYLKTDILASNSGEIQLINFGDNNQSDSDFDEFAKRYDFKSMILVPIFVEKQVYGFINIFSKRLISSLFVEDKTFLSLIATKGAISAQYEKLIDSFIKISNVLPTENLDRILQHIADNASKILFADPVILFRYDPRKCVFNGTISGSLHYPKLEKIINVCDKPSDHLALYIIKNGSMWFNNSQKYQEYIKKLDININRKRIYFEEDFWTREKIKSSVGIRLEHNSEPIGVMFFNYREEQSFDKDTKRFIEAFSSLVSSAIVNAKYQDLIERQKKELEEQSIQILTQKEKLEFENEEIYRKMAEMLPRATRTSFYLILEGINHDIRNFLIRMKDATLDIKDSAWKFSRKERNTINVRIKDIDRNIRNVTNLLELFDFKNSGKEGIKINDLIKELTFFFKTRESETINFNTEGLMDEIPMIVCNKAELSMIIYNLLSNAVYAIIDEEKSKGEIKITTDFKENEYIIVVEDNGVGIDKKDMSLIFEAGFTTRSDGMGIGLYFVSETLRENFYGIVECESQYGHWTRFTIRIPESVNYKED